MSHVMLTVILLLCLFCGVSQAAEDGQDTGNVRCEASAVHLGGEGQLTCHYPMDLNQLSGSVNVAVQQYVGESDQDILDCLWGEIYQCTEVRQGYKITKATGNTMTVTIANVTREQEGRYRCVLRDKRKIHGYEFCNLTVTGSFIPNPESETSTDKVTTDQSDKGNTRCEVTAVHWGGEGQLTCHYPMDLDKWSGDVNVAVHQFVGRSERHILDCLWDGIYKCTDVRQGYKITKATGNIMTITKANVSREQEGRYRCVLVDATGVYGFEFCNSTVTRFFTPGPESETGADEAANGQPAGVIVAIGICTLLFIVILVFVVCRCRKRRIERAKGRTIPSTLEWEEIITGNGGMAAGETGDRDRNGRLCSGGSGSGFADNKTETEAAVTLLNKNDDDRAERPKIVKYRTTPGEEQQTGNGDVPTGESTAENRNGSSYEPDLEDINSLTKGAIASGNEGDQGRSKKQGPRVIEMVNQYEKLGGETPIDRKSSGTMIGIDHFRGVVPTVEEVDSAFMDTQPQPVVRDHPPTASLKRLGNQRMENGKMAENTVRQDVASDADYTADKVAVSTPLLPSDQRPEVEPAMDELDPRASQSSSLLKSPPQTSQPESWHKQDLEENKNQEKRLRPSHGFSPNRCGGLTSITV